jgi:hypothetical protein
MDSPLYADDGTPVHPICMSIARSLVTALYQRPDIRPDDYPPSMSLEDTIIHMAKKWNWRFHNDPWPQGQEKPERRLYYYLL